MTTMMRPDLQSPPPPVKLPTKRWIPFALLFIVLGLGYLSFTWAIGAVIHSRPVVMVPDLNSKSISDALTLLSQAHLGLIKEGEQFDKRYPARTIIRQNPAAGTMVREGHV